MATLSAIRGQTARIVVNFGDPSVPLEEANPEDLLALEFRQHAITGKMIEDLATIPEGSSEHREFCKFCVAAFVSWDLKLGAPDALIDRLKRAETDGDNELMAVLQTDIAELKQSQAVLPLTVETLIDYVPITMLSVILDQIQKSRVIENPNATHRR